MPDPAQNNLTYVPALILPVSVIAARAWASGWINDVDLLMSKPANEAMYFLTLPNREEFPATLAAMVKLYHNGARYFIVRARNDVVIRHIKKWGAKPSHQDPSGNWRYVAGPEQVHRFFSRFK